MVEDSSGRHLQKLEKVWIKNGKTSIVDVAKVGKAGE